ncbi:MAG: AlpA family phage regulatory protein [Chloroflexota bacterium]
MAAGTFPRSIILGANTVAWVQSEVNAWIRGRILHSRGPDEVTPNSGG